MRCEEEIITDVRTALHCGSAPYVIQKLISVNYFHYRPCGKDNNNRKEDYGHRGAGREASPYSCRHAW